MKRAIVLGGGGARGPYQIGVWKALRELGIEYHIVTGSSVGALNGALMAQNDYQLAVDLWQNLTIQDVVSSPPNFSDPLDRKALLSFLRATVENGGMDIAPLERIVRASVKEELVRTSGIRYGLVTAQFPSLRPVKLMAEEIPQGELVDYMMASSSWFPFFQRRTIDGFDYIDGAYSDNLPAELAASCGADQLIAVDLQGAGIVHPFRLDIPILHIRCHWSLGGMMAFDATHARQTISMGYLDGLKAFHRMEGNAYAFPLGSTRNNAYALRAAVNKIRRRTGVSLYRDYQRLPHIQELLRYRSLDHRFLPGNLDNCTPGCAITTSAELAGELLQLPPETPYTFSQFNARLSGYLPQLRIPLLDGDGGSGRRRYARMMLGRIYRVLRNAYISGVTPDALWGMAALSPAAFAAANYLLALELYHQVR